MPLVSCEVCGNQISDNAIRCPYCGDVTENRRGRRILGRFFIRIFWVSLIMATTDVFGGNK